MRVSHRGMPRLGTNGKGTDRELALASALAEFMERLQSRMLVPHHYGPRQLRPRSTPDERSLPARQLLSTLEAMPGSALAAPVRQGIEGGWLERLRCVPFVELSRGQRAMLPHALVRAGSFSTGLCAGNTAHEAIIQGLCEVYERYALGQIFFGAATPRDVPREVLDERAGDHAALIRTIDESFQPGSEIDKTTILSQADDLILGVTSALEGEKEVEIVRMLLNFRRLLENDLNRGELSPQANAARAEIVNIVNNFFHEKLTGIPSISEYIENLQK